MSENLSSIQNKVYPANGVTPRHVMILLEDSGPAVFINQLAQSVDRVLNVPVGGLPSADAVLA